MLGAEGKDPMTAAPGTVPTPGTAIGIHHRDRRLRAGRTLAVGMTAVVTLAAGSAGASATTATSVVAATRTGSPSTAAARASGFGGDCGGRRIVQVHGTGVPVRDKRNIQRAIVSAEGRSGCALLIGRFNLGVCVFCLVVTGPVTVSGQTDPTGPSPERKRVTVVSTTGGVGSLVVDEPANAPAGVVQIRDIWWKGGSLVGLGFLNFYRGTLEYFQNRISDVHERNGIAFGIGGSTTLFPGSEALRGSLMIQHNYIDTTTSFFAPGLHRHGSVVAQGTRFNTVDISHNRLITTGEAIDIEHGVGLSYNVSDNTIAALSRRNSPFAKRVVTVGYPGLRGGYPAALKLNGVDIADVTILNNDITAGGGSRTMVCMEEFEIPPSRFHPIRLTEISGNRCTMGGIFAGLLGGWAGLLPFNGPGSMNNAIVTNNTFLGTAAFGMAMLDFKVPSAPDNNLVNTSHDDVFRNNNFLAFTAGKASLYFGPSTHDNIFVGALSGTIVNLGKHNVIITR